MIQISLWCIPLENNTYKRLLEIPSLSAFFAKKYLFRIDGFDCNRLFSEVNYVLPIAQKDLSHTIIEIKLIFGITANKNKE